jgi:uracil-DNA glycosylase family 4
VGARLTFVGEALGYEEAIAGEPFYGSAGGVLSRICHRAGIPRAHCRIANVVSCRPPQDWLAGSPWEHAAVAQCRQYLTPVLDSVPDGGCVVTLGATALGAVLQLAGQKGVTVKDFHGTVHEVKRADGTRYWVVPSFHPSHLQRGAMNLLEIVTQDFRVAWDIAHKGFVRSACELVVDPSPAWLDRWCTEHVAKIDADADGTHLSIDTEFLEKTPGSDEGELLDWNSQSPMTRVNGADARGLGWTVPYSGEFIPVLQRFFEAVRVRAGWMWLWNKYADLDHLRAAGHRMDGIQAIDGMWLWKHIQTDVPRGLGFVAPLASDFGAWKHWAHIPGKDGEYAAGDGVQNWRVCMWLMKAALKLNLWDMFMRDWHERDLYVLRPAYEMGVPINRAELVAFHESNQKKLGGVLERIKETAAKGVLKPKLGYAKAPTVKCERCKGEGTFKIDAERTEGEAVTWVDITCDVCHGAKRVIQATPPASILGKPKKGGGEAKQQYMMEGVRLVEAEIDVEVRVCRTCGTADVGPKHKCPIVRIPKVKRPRRKKSDLQLPEAVGPVDPGQAVVAAAEDAGTPPAVRRVAEVVVERRHRTRWFWQLPFNPDAPAQVLAYLAQQGIAAPIDKKKQKATTNKKALSDLAKQHKDDPFFQLQLDWKALQKVDAVYAVGTLALLDADDRVHPEYLPIPSTLRDSARRPNLTNVVADKSGVQGLASGFRRVIEARDGVPKGVTLEEYERWEQRWTQ